MKIGIFDSGLGGLLMAQALRQRLPDYDYLYLGDTKHLPYGDKSEEAIYKLTRAGVAYLLEQDCALIIIACNSASAQALRRLQQEWLPSRYPDRRILGVIVPTAEAIASLSAESHIGIIATASTIRSRSFEIEIAKLAPRLQITALATPELVPIIEGRDGRSVAEVFAAYAAQLREADVKTVLLGCTHYPLIATEIEALTGVTLISQTAIVPAKLEDYLQRHPEIKQHLSATGSIEYRVTELDDSYHTIIRRWFGEDLVLSLAALQSADLANTIDK